jgi:hypothetical protein
VDGRSRAKPGPGTLTGMDADEALRRAGRAAALSHETAARCWGVELLEPGRDRLTVPRNRSRLVLDGWVVVRAGVGGDVAVLAGRPVTSVARTVADLARVLPCPEAVAAADSALRQGLLTADELAGRLRWARGRDASRLRAVARAVDPLCGSVLETLLRLALADAGLPAPVTQHPVRDRGSFVGRVDFCWPDRSLVVEADGFAFHADRLAYRRDRERQNQLERLGWRVLRFTWEDVRGSPEHVVALIRDCLRIAA